ncbi:Protein crumbs [Hypsibius exemplaris]|uniref:Protein crumbs n=1 Tax=Hypsibius exemplaris TaxID=2072580 RepID=A0A9X6NI62_HYPEX|nr:Protein crumbs [Hypsibius exemplaris]
MAWRRNFAPSSRPLVAWLLFLAIFSPPAASADIPSGTNNITSALSVIAAPVDAARNDLCLAYPCQNNATCVTSLTNPGDSFSCVCQPGWTGRLCDVDVDECSASLNRCQNGAMCRNFPGRFQCYCVPGYLGEFCDMEANECLTNPCRNGAACTDKLNGYDCHCAKGYTGKRCEVDINECQPNPCQNGAICNDFPAAYNCTCQLGFTGVNCQVNIDNCEENPCRNAGRCVDGVNNFTCNCMDTGFSGRFCEHEIDDCASSPCQHNGTCKDIGKDYRCRCFDGYLGKNCEVDIDECQEPVPPCKNNATCYERSNISHYLDRTLLGLDRAFSYEKSAGYVCVCPPGFKGKNCDVEIDECETSPCRHGACSDLVNAYQCTCGMGWEGKNCDVDVDECQVYGPCSKHGRCENQPGSFLCKCDAGFGGTNCSVALTGCDEHGEGCPEGVECPSYPKCAEGSTCQPFLTAESPFPIHNFTCVCPVGRAGRYCQSSSVASLAMDGYLQLLNQTVIHVSFDFRTTLNDSLLLVAFDRTLTLALQINAGRVELLVTDLTTNAAAPKTATFTRGVSDGKWYTVALLMEINVVTALLRPTETGLAGVAAQEKRTVMLVDFDPAEMPFGEVFIGGVEHRARIAGTAFRLNMVGCLRDISVNGDVLVPVEMNSATRRRQPSVRGVCERKEQCSVNTCNRRGRCSDLWNHYECACDRPYYGLSCEKEILAGTFGKDNISSSVTINLTDADRTDLELRNHFSFRIRTLENNTVLLYLGSLDRSSFLELRLINGRLVLNVKLTASKVEPIFGPMATVSDGTYHFVTVQREQTMVEMVVDAGQPTFGQLVAGSPLKADILILGQSVLQPKTGKVKRQAEPETTSAAVVVRKTPPTPGTFFKGVLQDFRLNGKLVPFFRVIDSDQLERLPPTYKDVSSVGVVEGAVSEDTCRDGPCRNGGTCEVTWNDFRCTCPIAFRGRTCELSNFCLSNECPSSHAQCKKVDDDYECRTSISFLDTSGYVTYVPTKSSSSFQRVSFRFRTRNTDAKNIFSLTSSRHELKIYLRNSRIQIEFRLSPAPTVINIDRQINDAVWHNFSADFQPRQMSIILDSQTVVQELPTVAEGSLSTILHEDNAYVQLGGDFVGCLDDVRLGRHLLPLFPILKIHSALDLPRIVSIEKMNGLEYGCHAQDTCHLRPCVKGKCVDVWNDRHCECDATVDPVGCELRNRMDPMIALCAERVCQNGGTVVCDEFSNEVTNHTVPSCLCAAGFTGNECETHVAQTASPPDQLAIILGVTLSVAFLLLVVALTAFCITARRKRAERGTYSPNRQEHFGRVEMDYVLKPPPKEGLI